MCSPATPQESERRLGIRDATRAAISPTTGMASTTVIRMKLSGITSRLRRSKVLQIRDPDARRTDTGRNAAFYPEGKDRGKNACRSGEVFGFDTPSSTGERSTEH